MKKLSLMLSLAGILGASNLFADMTVDLTLDGGNANGGGLFKAVTSGNGTFDTFCISVATYFSPGTTYYYQVSPTIAANGIPPASSFISYGTAYLYDQFLHGNSHYAGVANANAVQAAIWYLQGDLGGASGYVDPDNNADLQTLASTVLNQLQTDTGESLAALKLNGSGAFGVEAMNLYATQNLTGTSQPQLIEVPEPTTMIAGALLVLPFGASTLRILRKRQSA
jgi:hypothetical protein